ncbi:MAG: DUF4214 domain-containing protein [Gemmiger sp.]|nr:DUF4214 domain-containing protein [Gemmiger sp.]
MVLKDLMRRCGALALALGMSLSAFPLRALAEATPATPETAQTAPAEEEPLPTLPLETETPPPEMDDEPEAPMGETSVFSSESFTKITAAEDFTTGDYVLAVDNSFAMNILDGTWVTAASVTPEGDTVTNAPVWTVTVAGGTATLTDANGKSIAPAGGNINGIQAGSYSWGWAVDEAGSFTFTGQGEDTVTLASNKTSSGKFRAYKTSTATGSTAAGYPHAFTLYKKAGGPAPTAAPSDPPTTGLAGTLATTLQSGDQVAIVLPKGSQAISTIGEVYNNKNQLTEAAVTLAEGAMTAEAGTTAAVFDVAKQGDQYVFVCGGKYLTAGETGSNLSLADTATKYSIWELEAADNGYFIKNANAVYGEKPQYIEYFNNFTTYSMGTDTSIYTCQFYKTGTTATIPAWPQDAPTPPDAGTLTVQAAPASGASLAVGDTVTLKGAQGTEIYYTLATGTEPPADPDVANPAQKYTEPVTIPALPATIKAVAYRPATADAAAQTGTVTSFSYKQAVGIDGYQLYFGQLHAHTNISDGAGTVEQAFDHASKVENLDFLAVTDHSNSFDNDTNAGVGLANDCTTISNEFAEGRSAAAAITAADNDFVGLYGFEMTWSDGFGHINTFNTPGFESRNNGDFGNKSGKTDGYQLYYQKLTEVQQSLSQFNHPGTTFGDFQDFAFYTAAVDQRINLIEVGNGEGAIGASGYFPSYEYYTRALDKGWHVAPTNNQDNHKGNWGDSNTARSVVLATDLSQQGIYDAIGSYRVYATEDNDLSILYTLNGSVMGSILGKQEDGIHVVAQIADPTDADNAKVELIVNGGLVAGSQALAGCNGTVNFDLPTNDYAYYYLRVTQADKQIAVTAPVWTGEGVNAGLASTTCDTALVVKGEPVTITSALYNNTQSAMAVQSLRYSVNGTVVEEATGDKLAAIQTVAPGASVNYAFAYTPAMAGNVTLNIALVAMVEGAEQTFTGVLRLNVTDPSLVTRILVDGTHYNDYVTGYYKGNMGNFATLAAAKNAQVTIKQPGDTITEADLDGVALLVVSAPLRTAANGMPATVFEPEFVKLVADYAKNGGTVILSGLADYQDNVGGAPYCSTEQINPLLESMGATMRLNDDEVLDDDTNYNGGTAQTYRVYMDDFNTAAFPGLFAGMQSGQRYSAYSGASVNLGSGGVALVKGSPNCYSINAKARPAGAEGQWNSGKPTGSTASGSYNPDTAVVQKGNVVTLATEAVGSGRVYLAGTVFCSNYEISDSGNVDYGDASYANKVILGNLIDDVTAPATITPIADVRAAYSGEADKGQVFTVQGKVTAGNVEPNAFFDTIYIQDATGGLDIYPVASTDGTFLPGQTVQVTGSLDAYQGDIELRTISVTMVDASQSSPVAATALTLAQAGDYAANGGKLATVTGKVKSVKATNNLLDYAILTDGTQEFRVFFNNYIGYSDSTSAKLESFVAKDAQITAIGVIYNDPDGTCLRVRDRSEVTLAGAQPTASPTAAPTASPTASPTAAPTASPTASPTAAPTAKPTAAPTAKPTATPTAKPTAAPTAKPTAAPTAKPTAAPTAKPTAAPTAKPTAAPTAKPTAAPTAKPTAAPTAKPTAAPTAKPTATPTAKPTAAPTAKPTPTPEPVYSKDAKGFVTRLYTVCLLRTPDAKGLADWSQKLNNKEITGAQAAMGFVFSDEFQAYNYCNTCYVQTLYRAFLGREADAKGLASWVAKLESGSKREEIFNGFVGSDEFTALCKAYGIARGGNMPVPAYGTVPTGPCTNDNTPDGVTAFVTRLYKVTLNRAPDAPGLKDWTGRLWAHKASGSEVAAGFIFSKEFTKKGLSDADFVECLYSAFMGRPSDAAGKADWLGRLAKGATRQQVFAGFVGSNEFTALCSSYGIVRG